MFRILRITFLAAVLLFVALGAWLRTARSTDWEEPLWLRIYPVNADSSEESTRYIASLTVAEFVAIEKFVARETAKHGIALDTPLRVELAPPVREQPPLVPPAPGPLDVIWWSLKLRWWTMRVTDDPIRPDVRMFVRYHEPRYDIPLENSVGLQKGMVGIVNAFAGRRHAATNNVVIAHELLHTLGATDKYDPATGLPLFPSGYAEPARDPLHPQRYAEIMGGRIALSDSDAEMPQDLEHAVIGTETAREIGLLP
jgi:hypothetical protein